MPSRCEERPSQSHPRLGVIPRSCSERDCVPIAAEQNRRFGSSGHDSLAAVKTALIVTGLSLALAISACGENGPEPPASNAMPTVDLEVVQEETDTLATFIDKPPELEELSAQTRETARRALPLIRRYEATASRAEQREILRTLSEFAPQYVGKFNLFGVGTRLGAYAAEANALAAGRLSSDQTRAIDGSISSLERALESAPPNFSVERGDVVSTIEELAEGFADMYPDAADRLRLISLQLSGADVSSLESSDLTPTRVRFERLITRVSMRGGFTDEAVRCIVTSSRESISEAEIEADDLEAEGAAAATECREKFP